MQPAATDDQIAAERDALRERFGATIPEDYASFLRLVNGIDFDGIVLYGAGRDQLWSEAGHLALGETDMDLLTVDLDGGRPALRDKVSGDVAEEFASVDQAIERLLGSRF